MSRRSTMRPHVDTRMLRIELQAEAQRLGLIPKLPLGQAA
jgi:hypothetical protein